jgi:glutathione S-transferase
VLEHYTAEGRAALAILDGHLAGRDWLVGEGVTIADIDIYGVLAYASEAGHDLAAVPNVQAWTGRMQALPGFREPAACLPRETRPA